VLTLIFGLDIDLSLVAPDGTQATDESFHPALFSAAASIFLRLYLFPAVYPCPYSFNDM